MDAGILVVIVAAVVVIGAFVALWMNQNKTKNDKRRYSHDEGNTDLLITQINDPQDETKPRGSR